MPKLEPRPGNSGCMKPKPKIIGAMLLAFALVMRHPIRVWRDIRDEL